MGEYLRDGQCSNDIRRMQDMVGMKKWIRFALFLNLGVQLCVWP